MRYIQSEPGSGSALPDGEYEFEVTDAEEKTSNSSGNDMIELTLKIKGGPTVYDYLVAADGSYWKLDNFRAAIGEEIKPGVPVDLDPDSFIGRKGRCLLYTDEYQGRKKNKIADYVVIVSQKPAAPAAKDSWR